MIRFLLVLSLLVGLGISSGCHVLLRLGQEKKEEEPGQKKQPAKEKEKQPGKKKEKQPGKKEKQPKEEKSKDGKSTDSPVKQTAPDDQPPLSSERRLIGNTGINFQSALAPGKGQVIYRSQFRFLQSHSTPASGDINVNLLVNPHVLVYGEREDLTFFGVVPLVVREGTVRPPSPPFPAGRVNDLDDRGVADMRFFAKYRFWERDKPGETTRWSVYGGVEVPSYDKHFSSDSWDPFVGTVWTYQSLEWGFDWNLGWQANTGGGVFRHDELFYDTAYTYVLLRGRTHEDEIWQLNGVFEFNGSYLTDGSHLLFAAPGFQLIRQRLVVEASLQLPVVRDVKNDIEPDFAFTISTRITW